MKNPLFLLLSCAIFGSCKTAFYPQFEEAQSFYQHSMANNGLDLVHQFGDGAYHFDVCMKDTTIEEQGIKWFCDCAEKDRSVMESITMLFVDDVRVLYFKDFNKKQTEFNIGKLDRQYTKLGIYKVSGANGHLTEMKVLMNNPSSKDSVEQPVMLFFSIADSVLSLTRMDYVKRENGVVADTEGGPIGSSAVAKFTSITPADEFSYSSMDFVFAPTPYKLTQGSDDILSIEYKNGPQDGFKREVKFKAADKLPEIIDLKTRRDLRVRRW